MPAFDWAPVISVSIHPFPSEDFLSLYLLKSCLHIDLFLIVIIHRSGFSISSFTLVAFLTSSFCTVANGMIFVTVYGTLTGHYKFPFSYYCYYFCTLEDPHKDNDPRKTCKFLAKSPVWSHVSWQISYNEQKSFMS